MVKIIGLTGGIASGKSTVVAELHRLGYQVIDADQVVHELQAKGGKLYEALVGWLGTEILDADGNLDRSLLSQLIFSSPENLKKSSQLQDQIIRQELAERRDKMAEQLPFFFMDIPLLIEADYVDWFDQIWLVTVDPEVQKERLMRRNGYSAEEADKRLASQMPLSEKKAMADVIIDNNGSLGQTMLQVHEVLINLN